jgi:pimeloyl-ACP methyl ester carboxylesterase
LVDFIEKLQQRRLRRAGFQSCVQSTEHGDQHYYSLAGSGHLPPIVFFHGIGASASSYAPMMRRVRHACQETLALDLPGHGLSAPLRSASGYQQIFDVGCGMASSVIREPAIVFGNSMGGAFALEFAKRHPELVSGLVLCSPAGSPMDAGLLESFLTRFDLDDAAAARQFVERVFSRPPWYSFLMLPLLCKIFASPTVRGVLASLAPHAGVTREELHALTMPILFIWGKRDGLLPGEHLHFYRQNLPPHARIVEPETFGHCPQLEEPGTVSRMLLDFAKDVHERRAARGLSGMAGVGGGRGG